MTPQQQIAIYLTTGLATGIAAYIISKTFVITQAAEELDYRVQSPKSRLLLTVLAPVANLLKRVDSEGVKAKAAQYDQRIMEAGGFWGGVDGYEVYSAQFTFAVLFPAAFLFLGGLRFFSGGIAFFGALALVVLGWLYAQKALDAKAGQRQALFLKQIPYAMDILRVATEAGLDFQSAIDYMLDAFIPGPVMDEFRLYKKDIKLGRSAVHSLNDMAGRINIQEVSAVIASISQAIEMGTSISNIMKIASEEMRDKRRVDAEESANKAVVKITLPLLLLILPGVFLVLLAPIIVDLFEAFAGF